MVKEQAQGERSSRPSPSNESTDGFMDIPDSVDGEGLPFN